MSTGDSRESRTAICPIPLGPLRDRRQGLFEYDGQASELTLALSELVSISLEARAGILLRRIPASLAAELSEVSVPVSPFPCQAVRLVWQRALL
ncbi:hypothetical protein AOLI_G00095560 [Acnodon oligacanthus]